MQRQNPSTSRRAARPGPSHRKAQEKAESELLEAKTEAANATADARRKKADLEHMKARREAILAEYKEAAAETWDEHREICPTCGQALPEEKVEELRADFLQRRSDKLEAINTKGKKEASKEAIAQLEQDIAALEEKAAAAEAAPMKFTPLAKRPSRQSRHARTSPKLTAARPLRRLSRRFPARSRRPSRSRAQPSAK